MSEWVSVIRVWWLSTETFMSKHCVNHHFTLTQVNDASSPVTTLRAILTQRVLLQSQMLALKFPCAVHLELISEPTIVSLAVCRGGGMHLSEWINQLTLSQQLWTVSAEGRADCRHTMNWCFSSWVWKRPWPNLLDVSMNLSSTFSRARRLVWVSRDWTRQHATTANYASQSSVVTHYQSVFNSQY